MHVHGFCRFVFIVKKCFRDTKGIDKMKGIHKKGRSNQRRYWLYPIIAFAVSQCIFIFFELISWTPNFREGTLFQKIYETKLFTDWFSPYSTPRLNLFTAVFVVTLLPYAIKSMVKEITSRK